MLSKQHDTYKKLNKDWKIKTIEQNNPDWADLYFGLSG